MRSVVHSWLCGGILGGLALLAAACGSDTTGPTIINGAQLYWALRVNYAALNLALPVPYDTIQLQTTAVNAAGSQLPGTSLVVYTTPDSNISVSAAGLVTAHFSTNGVPAHVYITCTAEGETRVDTVSITVDTSADPLATFSIQPRSDGLDSAKIAVDESYKLNQYNGNVPVYITDVQGDTLCDVSNPCGLAVTWSTSDPTIATIDPNGIVTAERVGHVTFMATTFAYGRVWRDSLPFIIGYPINPNTSNQVYIRQNSSTESQPASYAFWPTTITIGVGGGVDFPNYSTALPNDVIFDDSTTVTGWFGDPGGNIPADTLSDRIRVFPVAGAYHYHSRLLGASGTIIASTGP